MQEPEAKVYYVSVFTACIDCNTQYVGFSLHEPTEANLSELKGNFLCGKTHTVKVEVNLWDEEGFFLKEEVEGYGE